MSSVILRTTSALSITLSPLGGVVAVPCGGTRPCPIARGLGLTEVYAGFLFKLERPPTVACERFWYQSDSRRKKKYSDGISNFLPGIGGLPSDAPSAIGSVKALLQVV